MLVCVMYVCKQGSDVFMCVCMDLMYVCVDVCVHVNLCMYGCVDACMHIWWYAMYVCMHLCMHASDAISCKVM